MINYAKKMNIGNAQESTQMWKQTYRNGNTIEESDKQLHSTIFQ